MMGMAVCTYHTHITGKGTDSDCFFWLVMYPSIYVYAYVHIIRTPLAQGQTLIVFLTRIKFLHSQLHLIKKTIPSYACICVGAYAHVCIHAYTRWLSSHMHVSPIYSHFHNDWCFFSLKKKLNVWSRDRNAPVRDFSTALGATIFSFFAKKKPIIMKMRVRSSIHACLHTRVHTLAHKQTRHRQGFAF